MLPILRTIKEAKDCREFIISPTQLWQLKDYLPIFTDIGREYLYELSKLDTDKQNILNVDMIRALQKCFIVKEIKTRGDFLLSYPPSDITDPYEDIILSPKDLEERKKHFERVTNVSPR
jgi:hypothetical protein